jgi:hypothetical protein
VTDAVEASPPAEEPRAKRGVFTLGEVEVTAGKDEEPPTDTKLDQEELRLFDRKDVAEAAALVPGASISKGGPPNDSHVRESTSSTCPSSWTASPLRSIRRYPDLGR